LNKTDGTLPDQVWNQVQIYRRIAGLPPLSKSKAEATRLLKLTGRKQSDKDFEEVKKGWGEACADDPEGEVSRNARSYRNINNEDARKKCVIAHKTKSEGWYKTKKFTKEEIAKREANKAQCKRQRAK
jgi:hypothetical protein